MEVSKTEFLGELKNSLAMLEEKEQRDTLEEYTRHIDMKMERGLSEGEAIGGFGDLDQLAAEILEAYHVNPGYGGDRTLSPVLRVRDLIRRARSGLLGIAQTAERFLHGIAAAAVQNAGVLTGKTRVFFSRIPARRPCFLRHLRTKMEVVDTNGTDFTPSSEHSQIGAPRIPPVPRADHVHDQSTVQNTVRNAFKRAGSSMRRVIKGILCGLGVLFSSYLFLALWCMYFCSRWTWDILLFILTLFNGCLTLFSLYLLAVFLVQTVQGYPFAGPTLLNLDIALCAGSFSILCISLLRLRHNTGNTALSTDMDQNASEEVQHA